MDRTVKREFKMKYDNKILSKLHHFYYWNIKTDTKTNKERELFYSERLDSFINRTNGKVNCY